MGSSEKAHPVMPVASSLRYPGESFGHIRSLVATISLLLQKP